MYTFLSSLFLLLLLAAAFIFYLRMRLQDGSVPISKVILPANAPQRVMLLFPHPDDEIVVAGTLLLLEGQGIETVLVTLTHGEKGPTGGLIEPDELGKIRPQELKQSASILGIDHLEVFAYPDSGIESVPPAELKKNDLRDDHPIPTQPSRHLR